MSNSSRQPVTQKSMPGAARYSDATRNSVVGKNTRTEVVDVDTTVDKKPDIAPDMSGGVSAA